MPWNQSQLSAALQASAAGPRDLQEQAVGPNYSFNLIDEKTSNVGHKDEQKAEPNRIHIMHRAIPSGSSDEILILNNSAKASYALAALSIHEHSPI